MKQSSNGLVWGSILLGFGLLWLSKTLGWFDIEWGAVLRFWPLLLVGAGVALLARRSWSGVLAAVLVAVAIPSAIINGTNKHWHNWRDNVEWNFDDDDNNDNHNNDNNDEEEDSQDRSEIYEKDGDTDGRFVEALPKGGVTGAKLDFGAGAGKFVIEGTTNQLIEADANTRFGNYLLTTKRNEATKRSEVTFKMEGDSTEVNLRDFDGGKNKVAIRLNPQPLWEMRLGLGAGKGNFDLTDYKVKSINIEAGAANIDLKLGNKTNLTDVKIETGVTNIEIEVPETAGCELITDGALNARELDNFEKIKDGLYRTSNYDKATQKINIKYEGGLSKLEINRY